MQTLQTTSLRVADNQLFILDQQALPQEKRWLDASTVEALVGHIHALRVRGAPLIGLSASLLLALLAENGKSRDELAVALETLRASRPTAVNLMNNLDRMKLALWEEDFVPALVAEALRLIDEDKRLCDAIAKAGSALVKPGSRLLTHCNTGGLATAGVGTALGVIARAHQEGNVSSVWVDETRPLLQGGRLTAWELGELGVPYQLITDSMAASLMAKGQVDAVWVGADRIAANGDVANKIGTYSLAVLAKFHGIPFYVAAPQTTLDPACPNGDAIPIEQRAASEVTGVAGSFGAVQWAPEDAQVYNPAFDVTPASLISGWVLDTDLKLERVVDAPRDLLWLCWTTPDHIKNFFIPAPHKVTECDLDLRVGGRFNTVFEVDGQRMDNRGVFLEIDPGKKLVFTDGYTEGWKPAEKPFMTAILLLEDVGEGKTRYTAIARHPTKEIREQHEQMGFHEGWGIVLDQLVEYVKGLNA
ncbi:hypothetical protein ID866_430 [Astraeus odoratus]|nr:hypothetical protein ID866_430 [Astraeus odoratus]